MRHILDPKERIDQPQETSDIQGREHVIEIIFFVF